MRVFLTRIKLIFNNQEYKIYTKLNDLWKRSFICLNYEMLNINIIRFFLLHYAHDGIQLNKSWITYSKTL